MVAQGDFEIMLVDAKTKIPFKEHVFNGKVFVEVPPGVSYFISMRKVRISSQSGAVFLATFHVDGQDLGFRSKHSGHKTDKDPEYRGAWRRVDGVSTTTALSLDPTRLNGHPCANRIDANIYQGIFQGQFSTQSDLVPIFTAKVLDMNNRGLPEIRKDRSFDKKRKYKRGALLDTITLHYGSMHSLRNTGVLAPVQAANVPWQVFQP